MGRVYDDEDVRGITMNTIKCIGQNPDITMRTYKLTERKIYPDTMIFSVNSHNLSKTLNLIQRVIPDVPVNLLGLLMLYFDCDNRNINETNTT